jgi:hypothetical protein
MIDRGISENYVLYWLEDCAGYRERAEQTLRAARAVSRARRSDKRSLTDLYDAALGYYNGNQILAAEFLRRALKELANPTPVDDGLPPPGSWQWEHIRFFARLVPAARGPRPPPPPRYRRGSSR